MILAVNTITIIWLVVGVLLTVVFSVLAIQGWRQNGSVIGPAVFAGLCAFFGILIPYGEIDTDRNNAQALEAITPVAEAGGYEFRDLYGTADRGSFVLDDEQCPWEIVYERNADGDIVTYSGGGPELNDSQKTKFTSLADFRARNPECRLRT